MRMLNVETKIFRLVYFYFYIIYICVFKFLNDDNHICTAVCCMCCAAVCSSIIYSVLCV